MKLKQVQELSKNIEPQITELIDLKIENDMKEVINELKRIEDNFNTKFTMILWAFGIMMAVIVLLKIFS